jgi:hypothetical protein
MGIRLSPLNGQTPFNPEAATEPPAPSVLGAAFRQENDVYALFDIITRDDFAPDPTFDLRKRLGESELFSTSPESFIGVQSEAEFQFKEQKVAAELRDRQLLATSGIGGIAAAMLAGTLSPTILLPAGAAGRGVGVLKSAKNVAAWTVIGAGLQEVTLQANQELRTGTESATSIGGALVLGGILGGAIGYLSKGRIEEIASGMADGMGTTAIPKPVPLTSDPVGLSAEFTTPDFRKGAGGLAPSFGLAEGMARFNPMLRNFGQKSSDTIKWMQAQLTTGGLKLKGNVEGIASASGGNIEARTNIHYGKVAEAIQATHVAYAERADLSMSRGAFDEAVGMALRRGGLSIDPAISKAAALIRDRVFRPMFEELRAVQFPGFADLKVPAKLDADGVELSPAKFTPRFTEDELNKYVHRIYKRNLALREREDFGQIIAEHLKEKLDAKYLKKLDVATVRAKAEEQQAADLSLGPDQITAARTELEKEMFSLPQQFGPETANVASEIRALRAQAKEVRGNRALAKQLRDEAAALEESNKEVLQPFTVAESKLRKRFLSLDQTRTALKDKQAAKLEQIQSLEDMQLDQLASVARAGQRLLGKIARLEKDVPEEMARFEAQADAALTRLEKAEARVIKLTEATAAEAEAALAIRTARRVAFEESLAKMDAAQSLEERIIAVQEILDETLVRAREVNHKRSLRIAKLQEQAASIDPTAAATRAAQLRSRAAARLSGVMDDIEFNNGRIVDGKVDMGDMAKQLSSEIAEKLIGDHTRAPGMTLLMERGAELARLLDIDETRIWSNGKKLEDYLENNIDIITRRYIRTVAPDLEIYRTFGTVNPLAKDEKALYKSGAMQQIQRELDAKMAEARAITDPKKRVKAIDRVTDDKSNFIRDFGAQLDRLRHIRGVPEDPTAIGFRAGRAVLNLNVLRLMGGMGNSSIPDLAGPIMKFGLLNAFGDGFGKLITDLKAFKHIQGEAQAGGVAVDLLTHSRSNAMMDIFDEFENGTAAERGLQFVTNKMGLITGMDWLNTQTKTLAAMMYNAELMRGLDAIFNGTPTPAQLSFMADLGIGKQEASDIWKQLQLPGGSTRSESGVLMPNTEAWSNDASGRAAKRAYRAALWTSTNKTIVTPGIDRPLWIDTSMAARLISQFRSFTLAATTKILIAGAQDARAGSMAPVIGAVFSLALGALSYYTWASARGGKAYEQMMSATPEQWADQAIDRSGLLAVFGDLRKMARGTEIGAALTTFEGKGAAANPRFATPVSDQFGPSIDVLNNFNKIVRGIGQPNQASQTGEAIRNLMPLQNLLFLSRAFDRVQKMTTGGGNDGSIAGF